MKFVIPVVLTLSYPLLVHLAVWLEVPALQILALLVLTLGLLSPALQQGSRLGWGLFLLILMLLGLISYMDISIYLLYLTPVVIPLLLCGIFLRSLLPGEVPLVSAIAEKVRGKLSTPLRNYTRAVTLMWTLFFAILALESALLPWLVSPTTWSLITNFINYILAALLFVLEFIYRKWHLKDYDHLGFVDYIKTIFKSNIRSR
ncbi:MAG: hypothetical protein ACC650_02835 [Gammaproteobacteria bacterium]